MKKLSLILLLTTLWAIIAVADMGGWSDTAQVQFTATGYKYTKAFKYSGEETGVVVCADETVTTGLATDTFGVRWGIQFGYLVFDTSLSTADTLWPDPLWIADSLETDDAFAANAHTKPFISDYMSATTYYYPDGITLNADTLSGLGFFCQARPTTSYFRGQGPVADVIRYWAHMFTYSDTTLMVFTHKKGVKPR
jgi:hypothetical protein